MNDRKKGAQSSPAADQQKVAEVEAGLTNASPIAADVAAEVEAESVPVAEEITAAKLRNLWIQVKQREAGWLKARERAEESERALREQREELVRDRKTLQDRVDACAERESELAAQAAEIEELRSAAIAGFGQDRIAIVRRAAEERDAALEEVAQLSSEGRRKAAELITAAHKELDLERERLDEERSKLRAQESDLQRRAAQLADDTAAAAAAEEMRASRAEREVDARFAELVHQRDIAQEQLDLERSIRETREQELRQARNDLALFGVDPLANQARVDELAQRLTALQDELSRRPPATEVELLRQRAEAAADAEQQAAHWQQQYDAVDRRLRYQLISVGELEILRDERDVLRAQCDTLRQAVDQQRQEWEGLQSRTGSEDPFPACAAYDRDETLSRPQAVRDFDTLEDLADEVRNRMATDTSTPFYYSGADVRLFLAGLSASKLHLLQGMSGTGKTSLPREFFRALGGDDSFQLVEVQAGWRDRDDLFGYYNAFEKRYTETEFTKALYRALLPANIDRPMVIILDEMNLAHPEQYFGSMLSILENSVTERGYLDLLASTVPGLPAQFDGSRLPLPGNVWFVGTANHDETTVGFADKTYDRSHVQELPPRHEAFTARRQGNADPISYAALEQAFENARRSHTADIAKAKDFLNHTLRPELAKHGVGWGNRLERQIERFVPVVLEAGGSLTESVDHLVATKLVRKLEDKFGTNADRLEDLALNIELLWDLDGEYPVKTANRLRLEANRLREG